ncbi:MAG: non-heme iron oxygenase ferredoxin subunit [Actinomycetota bacterium]|nr:non-heme iron oxygenase ferredoxin subunit [Actinomycetota bacterium]
MADYETVARLDDVPDGGMIQVVVKGQPVGLYRVADRVYALGDFCSHEETFLTDGDFEPDDLEVECPLHGSRFNVETGAVRILPATRPVPAFEVKVEDRQVMVGPQRV